MRGRTLGAAALVLAPWLTARAQESNETPPPPSIRDAAKDDEKYRFLKLGEKVDYLRAERWRIIDQIEQAIPPLYEPVRPFHGYTLPPGVIRVSLSSTVAQNPGDFGTDQSYAFFFNRVKVDTLTTNLDIAYGFEIGDWIHDLVLSLDVPYKFVRVSGTGHPFRIETMQMTMEGTGKGIGDLSLTLKKKWLDQGDSLITLSTMTGVIFPTAEDDQEFNASQTVFMNGMPMAVSGAVAGNPSIDLMGRRTGDRLLPRGAQPGNGSWGARFGFGATHQFDRSALHLGAVFDLLADKDGISPGHELRYGISYVFPPFASDIFTIDTSIFGFWKGDERFPGKITHAIRDPATGGPVMAGGMPAMVTTSRPLFRHGNTLFFSISPVLTPTPNVRIFLSPAVRVLEPKAGPSPQWMVTAGATVAF